MLMVDFHPERFAVGGDMYDARKYICKACKKSVYRHLNEIARL